MTWLIGSKKHVLSLKGRWEKSGILMTRLPFIHVFMIPVSVHGSRRVRSTWPFYYEEAGVSTLSFLMCYDSLGKKKDIIISFLCNKFFGSSVVFSKDNPVTSRHDDRSLWWNTLPVGLQRMVFSVCSCLPPSYNLIIIAFSVSSSAIKWFYVSMASVDQNEVPFTLIH